MKLKQAFPPLSKIETARKMLPGGSSIFRRMFTILVGTFLFLGVFLMLWTSHVLVGNHRTQIARSAFSQLSAASRTVTQAMDDLALNMGLLFWNPDFVEYMVNPAEKSERDYRLVRQLKAVVDGNALVESASFSSPIAGRIYRDSPYLVEDAQEIYENYIISVAEKQGEWIKDERLHTQTSIVSTGGRLFVVQKLNIGSHIGTMLYELNQKEVSSLINLEDAESDIYIFDETGGAVLKGALPYSTLGFDVHTTENILTSAEDHREVERLTKGFYCYQVEESGWMYVLPINAQTLVLGRGTLLATFLPIILILLAFSVVLAMYIRLVVYLPIDRLMELVGKPQAQPGQKPHGGQKSRENEFYVLENAYSEAKDRQAHLADMLSTVAPAILENLIRSLIFGREIDMEHICEVLEGIGNPVPTQGRFVACACVLEPPETRGITDREWNLYYVSLQKMVNETVISGCRICAVRVDDHTLCICLCFAGETTELEARQALAVLKKTLLTGTAALPYTIVMENGSIGTQITGLKESFDEALDRVRYQKYLDGSGGNVHTAEQRTENPALQTVQPETHEEKIQFGRFRFREQTTMLVKLATRGEKEKALAEADKSLEKAGTQTDSLEERREVCAVFLDELVERLISYPLSSDDQSKIATYNSAADLAACGDWAAVRQCAVGRCDEVLHLIAVYTRKNRYKYIDQAKEYIAENYSNSSLSLNMVAEHIGISASYLSELFNEVSEEKFSAYLAKYRVEKARQLQSATNLTVKEIGYQCGFNSSQNFIRVYKKYTGVTPGQYKEPI